MQIKEICKPIRDKLDERLLEIFSSKESPLHEAASYCLHIGGKRARSLLVLLACQDLGGEIDNAYDAAIALELIHNYSLIHDDLPCMDNDDFRRGQPTLHKAFDESTAVLCGDFLLTHAFDLLAKSSLYRDDLKVQLIRTLSHYSGGKELLMGQILDLNSDSSQSGTLEDLQSIYLKKTSSLFCCALEFAVLISNGSEEVKKQLKEVGNYFGLAFQLQNDFLGSQKDLEQNKFTVLSLLSTKQAQILQKKYIQKMLETLHQCSYPFPLIKEFMSEILAHEI